MTINIGYSVIRTFSSQLLNFAAQEAKTGGAKLVVGKTPAKRNRSTNELQPLNAKIMEQKWPSFLHLASHLGRLLCFQHTFFDTVFGTVKFRVRIWRTCIFQSFQNNPQIPQLFHRTSVQWPRQMAGLTAVLQAQHCGWWKQTKRGWGFQPLIEPFMEKLV